MNKRLLRQNFRIILAITGKDILDAVRNKTAISVLFSALFLFFFYMLLPILEQDDIIRLYDAGGSTWLTALEDSQPFKISVVSTLKAMQTRISRSGDRELGLALPLGFDQAVAAGGSLELQGYLLNWVSEKQTSQMITQAETQIIGVVGVPVNISVERVFMLPISTGTGLSRAVGGLLLVMMIGFILVPRLMLEEKHSRTLDALLVSPATPGQIATGKALTGLFFCVLGIGLVCLFNASLIMQSGLILLACLCAALFTVSLGLLLGTMLENRQNLVMLANVMIFPMLIAVLISIETEVFPVWLTTFSRWLPLTAAFDLSRASFTPHTSLAFIAPRIADVLLFVIVFLGIVAWKIRRSDRM
jgi:ABC-type transport system involved in multi-copper enzyme maturation permease subunit